MPATMPRSCVISRMAIPVRDCRSLRRSRTCAWMVTSSAVVGSSAIRRSGSPARACAIITRCRIPPDSWNGYSSRRRVLSAIPTASSSSTARLRAAAPRSPAWRSSTSPIWAPTVRTGFRLVAGSWKIIAMRPPRTLRIAASGRSRSSVSPSRTEPSTTRPVSGSNRATESAVTLLPHPDSPTIANVSPRRMSRSTPSSARTTPPDPSSQVRKALTLSSVSLMPRPPPRLQSRLSRADRTRRALRRRRDSQPARGRA